MSTAQQPTGLGPNPNARPLTVVAPASPVHSWMVSLSAVAAALTFFVNAITHTPTPAPVQTNTVVEPGASTVATLPGTPRTVVTPVQPVHVSGATATLADPTCAAYLDIIKQLLAERGSLPPAIARQVLPSAQPVMVSPTKPALGSRPPTSAGIYSPQMQALFDMGDAYQAALKAVSDAPSGGTREDFDSLAASTFWSHLELTP